MRGISDRSSYCIYFGRSRESSTELNRKKQVLEKFQDDYVIRHVHEDTTSTIKQ